MGLAELSCIATLEGFKVQTYPPRYRGTNIRVLLMPATSVTLTATEWDRIIRFELLYEWLKQRGFIITRKGLAVVGITGFYRDAAPMIVAHIQYGHYTYHEICARLCAAVDPNLTADGEDDC